MFSCLHNFTLFWNFWTLVNSQEIRTDASLAVTGRAFSALLAQHKALKLAGDSLYGEENGGKNGGKNGKNGEKWGGITPLEMVLEKALIFARMNPKEKVGVIQILQNLGYFVAM